MSNALVLIKRVLGSALATKSYLAGLFVLMIKPFLVRVDIDDQAV